MKSILSQEEISVRTLSKGLHTPTCLHTRQFEAGSTTISLSEPFASLPSAQIEDLD
jgi:hypothetical protein